MKFIFCCFFFLMILHSEFMYGQNLVVADTISYPGLSLDTLENQFTTYRIHQGHLFLFNNNSYGLIVCNADSVLGTIALPRYKSRIRLFPTVYKMDFFPKAPPVFMGFFQDTLLVVQNTALFFGPDLRLIAETKLIPSIPYFYSLNNSYYHFRFFPDWLHGVGLQLEEQDVDFYGIDSEKKLQKTLNEPLFTTLHIAKPHASRKKLKWKKNKTISGYPEFYHQNPGLLYFIGRNFSVTPASSEVNVTYAADPNVYVYDYEGKVKRSFNAPTVIGTHPPKPLPVGNPKQPTNPPGLSDMLDQKYQYYDSYGEVFSDDSLIYRMVWLAKDSAEVIHGLENGIYESFTNKSSTIQLINKSDGSFREFLIPEDLQIFGIEKGKIYAKRKFPSTGHVKIFILSIPQI